MSFDAFVYDAWGSPDRLRLASVDVAPLAPDAVRIAAEFAGVNPADWKVLEGRYKLFCRGGFPRRIGAEGSGTVVAIGSAVQGFSVGMRVFFGISPTEGRTGSWARLADIPAKHVLAVPAKVTLQDAAVLPIAGLTAWLLCQATGVTSGSTVLVTAAAGGVGSFAVQIARRLGARVTATGSAGRQALLESLGAHDFIDHRDHAVERSGRQWDAILDCASALPRARSGALMSRRGRYADTDPQPLTMLGDTVRGLGTGRRWRTVRVNMQREGLQWLLEAVAQAEVRPLIGQELPLAEAPHALRQSLRGHSTGKWLLRIGR